MSKREFSDWDLVYKQEDVKNLPWYSSELDIDLREALEKRDVSSGTFLDLGTGPGNHAIALSRRGFKVTATDISENAIKKAEMLKSHVEFLKDDILNSKIDKKFDFIFDRGCFHAIDEKKREIYAEKVHSILNDNGIIFIKCFSDKEQDFGRGPYRLSKKEIYGAFSEYFNIESIKDSFYQGTISPFPMSWFITMRKRI